jgi:hypothetical protein
MISQIIIANILAIVLIAKALSQPHSKKCFTSANQIISRIKWAIAEAISELKLSSAKFDIP